MNWIDQPYPDITEKGNANGSDDSGFAIFNFSVTENAKIVMSSLRITILELISFSY
jgi:hypothetical protein